MTSLPLVELVATSAAVAATRSRKEKTAAMAAFLGRTEPHEAALAVSLLAGDPHQGRVGVGWATVGRIDVEFAPAPTLTIADIDSLIDAVASTVGPGSNERRHELLEQAFAKATTGEADFLRRLLLGDLRQGANEGLVVEGLAKASEINAASIRRSLMLSGDLGLVATAAMTGGVAAVEAIRLELQRPMRPMLASTAADVAEALEAVGAASVEWKLDGARVQVHLDDGDVRIWTRNLNEITSRLPEVVDAVRALPADSLVLDGEVMGFLEDDAPQAFQDTMSTFGAQSRETRQLRPFFFDILHRDGADLVDSALTERRRQLIEVAGELAVPGILTGDAEVAQQVFDEALAAGHEGVLVKAAGSAYEAGRRGKTWRKVKPVHTLDLAVLGAEWGHGRRQGWLSNLHLGARGPDGDFVMVGKTFKGLTDELLGWQTEQILDRRVSEHGITVFARPELVVEVALDGVQASTRYPGGVALRFARVKHYRSDKTSEDVDTIDSVRAMLPKRAAP